MTRKGLTRASSLDARSAPATPAPSAPPTPVVPPVEVVSSETARIDHADGDTTMGLVDVSHGEVGTQQHLSLAQGHEQARAQHHMSIVQAQAYANAATQRNTEERIQLAFEVTEARLHKTAEAIVRSHAQEQALETRRDLAEAIQTALIDAHFQAHAQAMVSAQDHLSQFTKEIQSQIEAQLARAVEEVSSRGVAYIKRQTEGRLALLPQDVQAEIERSVERGLLAVKQEPGLGKLPSDPAFSELQLKLEQLEAELPTQLAVCEKRSHDGAVASVSAQAQQIIAQAEHRLVQQIEDRFIKLEGQANETISAAVVRAETHCNVIEQRGNDCIKRAIDELQAARALRTEQYVDRLLEIKLEASIQASLTGRVDSYMNQIAESKWKPLVNNLVVDAVPALLDRLVATKVQNVLDQCVAIKVEERLQAVMADVVPSLITRQFTTSLQPHIQAAIKSSVKEQIDQHYEMALRPRVEGIVADKAAHFVNKKYEDEVWPRVEKVLASSSAEHEQRLETLKKEMRVSDVDEIKTQATAPQPTFQWPYPQIPAPTMQWPTPSISPALGQWSSPQIPVPMPQWPSLQGAVSWTTPPVVVAQPPAPTQEDVIAPEVERQINQALALAYPVNTKSTKTKSNQDHDESSQNDRALLNSRLLLAARMREADGCLQVQPAARLTNLDRPQPLSSLRPVEIQRFVTEYRKFETAGGRESWTAFCGAALLSYLRTVECSEGSSDDDILLHLASKVVKTNSDVTLIEKKFNAVTIDPEASNSLQKVQSILIGVETVLNDMGLKDSGNELGVAVPLETQMTIVMEKLPLRLRTAVQKRLKYAPPMKTKRQFAAILFEEAKYFTWPQL